MEVSTCRSFDILFSILILLGVLLFHVKRSLISPSQQPIRQLLPDVLYRSPLRTDVQRCIHNRLIHNPDQINGPPIDNHTLKPKPNIFTPCFPGRDLRPKRQHPSKPSGGTDIHRAVRRARVSQNTLPFYIARQKSQTCLRPHNPSSS